jgi:phosphoglycolate phosphatase-like HAD superfamily hydrolase
MRADIQAVVFDLDGTSLIVAEASSGSFEINGNVLRSARLQTERRTFRPS